MAFAASRHVWRWQWHAWRRQRGEKQLCNVSLAAVVHLARGGRRGVAGISSLSPRYGGVAYQK